MLEKAVLLLPILLLPLGVGRDSMSKPPGKVPSVEVLGDLYVAPRLQLHLDSGQLKPKDIIYCTPLKEKITFGDHTDSFVVFRCENGVKLVLDDVLFDLSPKIALKITDVHVRH